MTPAATMMGAWTRAHEEHYIPSITAALRRHSAVAKLMPTVYRKRRWWRLFT